MDHSASGMKPAPATPGSATDLHEHLTGWTRRACSYRSTEPVNKDTEMHPLVRWQFRGGIPEKDRKAFLFTNVVDSNGRKLRHPRRRRRAGDQS